MAKRYFYGIKTLAVGAVIGAAANILTNAGGYFGGKVIHSVSNARNVSKELDDGKGHQITYSYYPTSKLLLERILEGDVPSERVAYVMNRVFCFAQAEGIPCNCVPILTLLSLQNLDITIIVDDSTSMGTGEGSRWDECRKFAKMVARYGMTSIDSKVCLRFLNQKGNTVILDVNSIDTLFARNPSGGTPLIKTLEETIFEAKQLNEDRKHLLYVFTDGIPSDGAYSRPTLTWVRDVFASDKEVSDNVAINFIVTDTNPATEREYKRVDDFIPQDGRILHIDTNFSYKSQKARCHDIHLTEGLYKTKILLGAVDEDFDELDDLEKKDLLFLKDAWGRLKELNAEIVLKQEKKAPLDFL